ncbi:MAG: phytanoyl-CoA dioxygenase family protein [Acidimicrobiales bacterium]|nr:phytanoyl-CoA dioxygenase family protein [Acidimicrobiales bacterium]
MLTEEQIETFDRDGFVVIPDLIDPQDCQLLRDRTSELLDAVDPSAVAAVFSTNEADSNIRDSYFLDSAAGMSFFWEAEAVDEDGQLNRPKELAVNKFGHAMHDLDPVYDRFARRLGLAEVATDLGYGDAMLAQSMYIYKQPGIGGEVVLHNDHAFLWTEPMRTMGLWVALEPATLENGCLWAEPGGHRRRQQRSRMRRNGDTTFLEEWAPPYQADDTLVPLEASTGTVVAINGMCPHRSDTNRSDKSRHAYTLHIFDPKATWVEDNWIQRPSDLPFRSWN